MAGRKGGARGPAFMVNSRVCNVVVFGIFPVSVFNKPDHDLGRTAVMGSAPRY